jgi:membrane-associated PAP2 superfamily phosphatase
MSPTPSTPAVRESATTNRLWLWTVLCFLCLLVWDCSGLDLRVMQAIADHRGFGLRSHWWLERVLHEGARQVALLFYLGIFILIWWPIGRFKTCRQLQWVEVFVGMTLSLLLINLLKRYSLSSCPWDLTAFGGTARYVSHWQWGLVDGGPGQCFPGGHASAAMAFLALCMPWLSSRWAVQRRRGRRMLILVLALGALLGGVQTLRGAHYPSHTLWTGLLCWVTAMLNHLAFTRIAPRPAR